MSDTGLIKIVYSDRSHVDIRTIRNYLLYKFTQREVDKFYSMLSNFEKLVTVFPDLFPVITSNKKIHRAVLSKQLSVFYNYSKSTISIVAILNNRMDYAKWPK
jgi:plasmid stabilization system protein ParE